MRKHFPISALWQGVWGYLSSACNTSVELTCDNTDVIRISGSTITAVGYGTATITGECFYRRTSSNKIVVKEITANSVTVSSSVEESTPICIGDSLVCSATISPENVDNPSIQWSSSDNSIATVDQFGTVTAHKPGNITITARTQDGYTQEYHFSISHTVGSFFSDVFSKIKNIFSH